MATAKKSSFVLNMPSIEELENEVMTSYDLFSSHSAVTKRDQRLEAELETQMRGMNGYKMKSLVVSHSLTKLHNHTVEEIEAAADHHDRIIAKYQGKRFSEFIEEFCTLDMQLLGKQLQKTSIVAEHILHEEQQRKLDLPEPKPEVVIRYVERPAPPKGWLERLLGG